MTQLLAVHLTFKPPKPPEQQERQSVSALLKSSLVPGENDPQKKLLQITVRLHQTFVVNSISIVSIVARETQSGLLALKSLRAAGGYDETYKPFVASMCVRVACVRACGRASAAQQA